jgi:hypothetical protein
MDNNTLAIVLPSLASLAGTIIGVLVGNKLLAYRVELLEKKMDKHNGVIEKTYELQKTAALLEKEIGFATERIEDLEKKVG